MGGEEGGDDGFVFDAAEGAGGAEEEAAGADVLRETGEEFLLKGSGVGDLGGRGGPLEMRGAAPGAGAAARGVDEDAVVEIGGGGCGAENADVFQVGASGAGGEFGEGGGADIVRVDFGGGAEEVGELKGFAAGAGAGVEPATARRKRGGFEEKLGAEVLDFDEAVGVRGGLGDVDFVEKLERGGEDGGEFVVPIQTGELVEDDGGIRSLETEPERGAGEEGVDVGGFEGGGAVLGRAKPVGERRRGRRRKIKLLSDESRFGGDGGGCRGPVGDEGGAEFCGGGRVGGEPGDEAGGEIGVGVEGRFEPGQITEGGVDEFAVEAAVAGAEGAVRCDLFLDTRGEIAVRAPVRAQGGEEGEERALLVGCDAHGEGSRGPRRCEGARVASGRIRGFFASLRMTEGR